VLKNVYALAVGVADGLHWGSNRKGQLMTQALTEMQLIFAYLRCDTKVLLSNAGMGDFLATSLSPFSKNHELGVKVVRGEQCEGSEGACALQTLISPPLQSILPTLPLLTQLIAIFEKGVPAERAFRQIF
jgi:glycerol-3-phosphate dehydrogenase